MKIDEFRELVYAAFGDRLEHATPDAMHDFISRMYAQLSPVPARGMPLELPEDAAVNYQQIIAEFLARILTNSPDHAVILLWLFAAEQFYGRLAEENTEAFNGLLGP